MTTSSNRSDLILQNLRCEYKTHPLGIDARQPRLSWQLISAQRGAEQTAYQVQVAETSASLLSEHNLVWDSGKVISQQSIHVPYAGPALRSGQRCYWRVRAWDGADRPSEWSETAWWEMGLLEPADWRAQWIEPGLDEDLSDSQPCPLLRTEFQVSGAVKSARAYITALGLYEAEINGQRVGDEVFTPGWTSYKKRLHYQTYDVTGLLRSGANAIGVTLGDGWYRGYLGFDARRNRFGQRLALLLQLRVDYEDGRSEVFGSGPEWKASTGPIRMSDIYMGETYDARLEQPGWSQPGFDDRNWKKVRLAEPYTGALEAPPGPPVRRIEELRPKAILHTPAGETVFDLGQNMTGWVRLRVSGAAGTRITLRHAEVLDQQGNLYTENLRSARAQDTYILKGTGEEVYEPHFTFHGFRYVGVEGWPGEPTLDSLLGIVIHSDMPSTGSFTCSNPLINQLQHNIVWGQKGNFLDVPTDCPQRDERLGWTGDAQVFIRTAAFNMDVASFFTKWLRDLAADQHPNGIVPHFVPDLPEPGGVAAGFANGGSAAWADAATICPWTIYLCYGDKRILEQQYASMAAWVNYIRQQAGDRYLWTSGFHFGDWLDYRGPAALMPSPVTNKELIATAFFAHSTSLVMHAAQVLGKTTEAAEYAELLEKIKVAFNNEFVTPNGRVGPNSQTAYVLALHFDLLPEEVRPKAAARLAEEVRAADYHLTTGFVGTPYLCHVLSRFGYTDLAYELLNQESFPSWLYPVKKGATTIWERWDGIKPDGTFQDVSMNSFNHYAYGAIGDWLYRVAAGLDTDPHQPGYQHILIQPQPGGGLTHVRAALRSPYGEVVSAWQLSDAGFHLQVTVPPNTRATVRIPATDLTQVTESGRAVDQAAGVTSVRPEGNSVVVEIGAGQYDFFSTGLNLAQVMAKVRHVAGRLDIASSIRDLMENKQAMEVLVKYIREDILFSRMMPWFMDQSFEQVARLALADQSPEKLQALQQELAALNQTASN